MKFTSINNINGTKTVVNIPFKKGFAKNAAVLDDNYVTLDYELADHVAKFPFDIYGRDASFVINLTKRVLSASAYIDVNPDDESLLEYTENGDLEFKIDMSDNERNDLMMFLLRNFIYRLP